MKIRPTTYTFDASAQTIDCASFTSLEAIQIITNVTDNVIIYNFADPTKGGSLTSTTLTLTYDTTSMSDTDKLQILVETGSTTESVSGTVTANLGATDNAVLDSIDTSTQGILADTAAIQTAVETIDNAISGSEMQVDVVTSALPTGASTSAKQDTIIGHVDGIETSLGSVDTKTPALGQALAAASVPVVLTAAQLTTLTPVSTVTANAGTNLNTSALALEATATSIKTAVETIDNAISGSEMQVDVVASLPAGTNAIGRVGHDVTGIGHGVKTVTTAGTDVALATSTACKKVDIQAQTDNTGVIAVGATGVDATIATGTGIILYPGDVYSLEIDNLADIFIDSSVSGEGVRYSYYT